MQAFAYWLFTTVLCAAGFLLSMGYLILSFRRGSDGAAASPLSSHRPWRRLGAAICALVSVMFYAGIHHLDPARFPRVFIFYWIIILLLVVWLCGLALVDMLYTRKLMRQIQQKRRRAKNI